METLHIFIVFGIFMYLVMGKNITTLGGKTCVRQWRETADGPLRQGCLYLDGLAQCATEVDNEDLVATELGECDRTEVCRGNGAPKCIAFEYNNITYATGECTFDEGWHDKAQVLPWCAIAALNPDENYYTGRPGESNWDLCKMDC